MKAITLWQPWATLMALGVKRIETRKWATKHRGPLAIHASSRPLDGVGAEVVRVMEQRGHLPVGFEFPMGAIIATLEVVAVEQIGPGAERDLLGTSVRSQFGPLLAECDPTFDAGAHDWQAEFLAGDFTAGRQGWVTRGVRELVEPLRCRGDVQLWRPPFNVALALAK